MKNLWLLILTICTLHSVYAQEEARAYLVDDNFNLWNKQIGDKATVFADVAYIRDYPKTTGILIDSLTHGEVVTIKSEAYNPSVIRGYLAPWHEISYKKDGKTKTGFIWLGLLALGKDVNKQGQQFIHGLLKKQRSADLDESYLLEIKCLDRENTLINRLTYTISLNGQTYTDHKMLPNMGLEGLNSIHRIGILGEGCGIPTDHYYFGWNGESFINMFEKSSVSDAGIFYHEETILFPSEHKLDKNVIFKDIEMGEVIDTEKEDPQYNIKRERKKYSWDGKVISEHILMK